MAYKKMVEYNCPKCGNDMDNETEDVEWDCDCVSMKITCHKCDCSWREYFLLQYDGYAMDGKVYDKEGEVVDI
jgi:hypothetical protein